MGFYPSGVYDLIANKLRVNSRLLRINVISSCLELSNSDPAGTVISTHVATGSFIEAWFAPLRASTGEVCAFIQVRSDWFHLSATVGVRLRSATGFPG